MVFLFKFAPMPIYDSAFIYIETATSLKDKIVKVDAIITALYESAAKAATNEDIEEYWLDDGQTKIKTSFRSVESVYKSISVFEKLKTRYLNQLNGRTFQLRDGRNFRTNGAFR